jgi:hypothetical protein
VRAATAKLATRRFTSHSNGQGRVSSKSLTLKISLRSAEAKAPKFERCAIAAELHREAGVRQAGQIRCHRVRGATEVCEGRREHPPAADRNELGHAARALLFEQGNGIGPIRRRRPLSERLERNPLPDGLPACRPLGDGCGGRRPARIGGRLLHRPRQASHPLAP